ncbi:(3,5-dihydroxyphenyl)acetyl-CoA 1,2-dioxygenase DpgC [Duganella callida]|uniref:Enoyl-CoA hydratase/isomerase family protein n=1 Tax=Duganella callida TaxID=2561932 RepID=A0A4Y9SQS7_9BURK|nr:(3,5-dihydroxyphenyl)acetyl-CoA 1,2-dioxygenase DpgC [Duganella callida]TFW29132.1 enoyl-CoA hydratase/isomerase family protein [Duganella callida]
MRSSQHFTAAAAAPDWRSWLDQAPAATRVPDIDSRALTRHLEGGAALLAALPARPQRSAAQLALAAAVHEAGRTARTRFLRLHADWVYERLTEGRSRRPQLAELVYAAADAFPGLTPTRATIAAERTALQGDKEGYEIDQGIFFAEVLAAPASGLHLLESMLRPAPSSAALLQQFRRDGRLPLATLTLERRGAAAHLTMHNLDCLNAEDDQVIADMEAAVDVALLDDEVRVCVLRGGVMRHPKYAGRRVFSAGINLKQLHRGRISYVEFLLQRELGYISKMLRGVLQDQPGALQPRQLVKPWIAAVDSFAIGGGAQLLLVCDKVIGADDSFFSLPAAQEGIVPGVANLRLGRAVGARVSRQIILGGRRIRAAEADGRLLFDEVVAPEALDQAVERAVADYDSPAVVANKRMLTLAEEPLEAFRLYMAEFALEQAHRLYSADVLAKVSRA